MLLSIKVSTRTGVRSVVSLRTRSPCLKVHRCFVHHANNDDDFSRAAEQSQDSETRNGSPDFNRNGVFMGMVTSRTPQSTTIERLLAQIEPRPTGQATQRNDTNSLLTVLTTPAFAQHALDTNLPLHVLQRFSEHRVVSKSLDAVVAVVDRLPAPNGATSGVEGLAYAFVPNPQEPLPVSSRIPLQMSSQKPGSLSFVLPSPDIFVTTVHLPLAQTTFNNGLPSTLIHTHYDFDVSTGSLHQSSSERLESHMLRLPFGNAEAYMSYDMPFIPLTPVRKVMSSMGNIVRKLSPHSFTQEEHLKLDPAYQPEPSSYLSASQELETAVSDYFKLLDIAPGSVQVWALILPDRARKAFRRTMDLSTTLLDAERQLLEAIWTDRKWQGCWKMRQLETLHKGCRLARVLSGGGGWGKKAGLLSLDPDTGYSTRDLRGDQGWEFTFADEYTEETVADQQRQALGEVIKPGENVMFFLAPKTPNASLFEDVRYTAGSDRAMTLGVIPSSIDEVPEAMPLEPEAETDASTAHHHYHDTFGMLSEGGMALTITHGHNCDTQTKIDVPYGNITVRGSRMQPGGLGRYLGRLSKDYSSIEKPPVLCGESMVPAKPLEDGVFVTKKVFKNPGCNVFYETKVFKDLGHKPEESSVKLTVPAKPLRDVVFGTERVFKDRGSESSGGDAGRRVREQARGSSTKAPKTERTEQNMPPMPLLQRRGRNPISRAKWTAYAPSKPNDASKGTRKPPPSKMAMGEENAGPTIRRWVERRSIGQLDTHKEDAKGEAAIQDKSLKRVYPFKLKIHRTPSLPKRTVRKVARDFPEESTRYGTLFKQSKVFEEIMNEFDGDADEPSNLESNPEPARNDRLMEDVLDLVKGSKEK